MTPTTSDSAHGRPHWLLFLGIAAAVVVLDQLSKAWLVGRLDPGELLEILGEYIRLIHSRNTGALFGLFRDNAILFGIVSIGVIGLIVWYHGSSGRNTLLSIALGLLLGGAIGNMIDRLRLGYVVDFVDLGIGGLRFYTFNVADSAISCAILLLIVMAFLPVRRPPEATGEAQSTDDAPTGLARDEAADA